MTTILSTPTTVAVATPGTSELAVLAASMSSNSWAAFPMGGLNNSTFSATGPSVQSLLTFAARANWDPMHRKVRFAGTSHTGGQMVSGAGGLVTWDDATNQVTRESYTWSSENPGHSYYHTAINQNTGDMYYRSYNSASIYRRPYAASGQGGWSTSGVAPQPNRANQVSGGLEWFNELNGGAGGLVFVDAVGASFSNATLSSWTPGPAAASTNYDNWAVRANGVLFFGGGTTMYRLSSNGAVTVCATAPASLGPNNGSNVVLAHPNGQDLLAFQVAASGAIRRYSAGSNSWSSVGTHQINAKDFWVGCAVPEYGIIMFLVHAGASSAYARIYKP